MKAAVYIGHPPTAVIFSDPSHTEWTMWDYRMVKAHFLLEEWYRDGIPIWWDESDRVTFDAVARVSKSRAAVERAHESANGKGKKPVPGRYFVAEPRLIDGDELPTRSEWLEEQQRKSGDKSVSTKWGRAESGRGKNIIQGKK